MAKKLQNAINIIKKVKKLAKKAIMIKSPLLAVFLRFSPNFMKI